MSQMYSQDEAKMRVEELSNGEFELVGIYKGSREECYFKHKRCGKVFHKRWANFVDAFRPGSSEINCTDCGI